MASRAPVRGSCLCGAIRFEVDRFEGPFEQCHCTRCRKASGSAFLAGLVAARADFRWVAGAELVQRYEAPLLHAPPSYVRSFCPRCGGLAPHVPDQAASIEIPAGLLDDDPGLRPDKHIFVEHKAPWHAPDRSLPALTSEQIRALRSRS